MNAARRARSATPHATRDFPITNFGDLRYTGWGGGVPLVVDGAVVGAVGVSGLPEPDDMRIAADAAAVLTR